MAIFVLSLMMLGLWVLVPGGLALLIFKRGEYNRAIAVLVAYIVAASLVALGLADNGSTNARSSLGDFLFSIIASPIYYTVLILENGLYVALAICFGGLVLICLVEIRLRKNFVILIAFVLALLVVPLAVVGQGYWSRHQMIATAASLGLECVTLTPIQTIVADIEGPSLFRRHFGDAHALAKKDGIVWSWSFRKATWVQLSVNDRGNEFFSIELLNC